MLCFCRYIFKFATGINGDKRLDDIVLPLCFFDDEIDSGLRVLNCISCTFSRKFLIDLKLSYPASLSSFLEAGSYLDAIRSEFAMQTDSSPSFIFY